MTRICLFLLCLLALGGCDTREALDASRAALEEARARQVQAAQVLADTRRLVTEAHTLAKTLETEKGAQLIATADALLVKAEQQVETLGDAVSVVEKAHDAAEAAHKAGGGWLDLALVALGIILPAAGEMGRRLLVAKRTNDQLRSAVSSTARHADRMEKAETDEDVAAAKDLTAIEQEALKVRDLIASLRGK